MSPDTYTTSFRRVQRDLERLLAAEGSLPPAERDSCAANRTQALQRAIEALRLAPLP